MTSFMWGFLLSFLIVGFGWMNVVHPARAAMSSSNFQIQWDMVGEGGSDSASSSTYGLRDTVGNATAGSSSSATYQTQAGYRAGIFDPTLTFDIHALTNSTEIVAQSLVGTTVTVSSSSSFTVGDLILLIQDRGASEIDAIGRITAKTDTTLVVDQLSYATTLPVIDGTNDFVFALTSDGAAFGSLNATSVKTTAVGWEVNTDVPSGYTVSVIEDGDLRNGSSVIPAVTDGSVTVGISEYGARSSDTSLSSSTFDSQDTAFTTNFQDVATTSAPSFKSRQFLVLKASMNGSVSPGTYTQALSFIASANF